MFWEDPDPTTTPTLLPACFAVEPKAPLRVTSERLVNVLRDMLTGVITETEAPSPFLATLPKSRIALDMEDLLLLAAGVVELLEEELGAADSGLSLPS
jgi:hypothetical protein